MNMDGRHAPDATSLATRIDDAARASRHDPFAARADLTTIIEATDRCGHVAVSAKARYALARVLVTLGSAEAALEMIEDAGRDWRSIGMVDDAIRTNLGRMHVLDELGRHAEAVSAGRAMLAELEQRGADDDVVWLRAAAEENVGVALGYLGRHAEALDAYAAAARCYDRLGLEHDAARALANRGVELVELARPREAIPALERAHRQFVTAGDRLWQALCQTNLSQAWIATGRYLEAFRCLDAARSALTGLDRTTEWMRAELARARCLESLHLDVEALDLYDELVGPLSEAGLVDDLGMVHLGRGTILARASTSPDDALDAFESAFDAFESTGNNPMLARTCLATAPLHTDPMKLIDRAVALLADGERPAELAIAHLAAAQQLESVDGERAAAALERAAELIDPLGVPSLQWQLHHRTGRLRRRAGACGEARDAYEAAIAVLDAIRSSVHHDGIRQRFDGALGEPADDLIELLLDTDDAPTAFAFSDSIRSRGLADRLTTERPLVEPPPDELLSTYDRLLTASGPLAAELAAQARRLERGASKPADVGGHATLVRPDMPRNCVLYQTLGETIVSFVAGDRGEIIATRKMGELDDVEALLQQLDAQWRRCARPEIMSRHAAQLENATLDVLRRFHDLLIEPVRHHLSPTLPLVIVPDGPLGAVPFAALHDGASFLVQRQPIRQTPSIAIDSFLATRSSRPRSSLALGTSDRMAPLAASEAVTVGAWWPRATVHTGDEATSVRLFEQADEHDVVHISAHGMFRPDAPEFSAIRLADRWVTAAEIARLRLDGQLVVLSACDTGRRAFDLGLRETLGLPRAFIAAGAAGVIVNLWTADDEATTGLMAALHRSLAAGRLPAAALRSAQLASMTIHRHPYYWAGATLVGGPGPGSPDHVPTTRGT